MKVPKYCVMFKGKRSKAVPKPYAEGIQARFKKKYKGDFPIFAFEIVRSLKVYNALDLM